MAFDIEIVGYLAGICTAIAQFPQAYKVFKTGETQSISLGMYLVMTLGIFLWAIYGALLHKMPMILTNSLCLLPAGYVLYITYRNSRNSN